MSGPVVTATGLTAFAMQAIANASVVAGAVNSGTGHLHLTTHGGTDIDAGSVVGPVGPTGPTAVPNVVVKTVNYTAVDNDIVYVNATSANVIITVPVALGKKVIVKRLDGSAFTVKVQPATGIISDNGLNAVFLYGINSAVELIGDGTNVGILNFFEGGTSFPRKVGPFNVVIASGTPSAINSFQIKPISLGGTVSLWNCLDANAALMGVSIVSNYLYFTQPGSYEIAGYITIAKGASAGRVLFEAVPELTPLGGTLADHDNVIRLDHSAQVANDSFTYNVATTFEVGATPLYLRFQHWDGAGPTVVTSGSVRISRRG